MSFLGTELRAEQEGSPGSLRSEAGIGGAGAELRCQPQPLPTSPAGLCRPCSWNWEFFQGNCYFFSQTKDAWKASVAACQGMKAQLVIVNTTEEQVGRARFRSGAGPCDWSAESLLPPPSAP